MSHFVALPLLLPLIVGILMVMGVNRSLHWQRSLGLLSTVSLVVITGILLLQSASGPIQVYAMGDWNPPFGIVLVVDRLSAFMIFITAVLSLFCLLYAMGGTDSLGKNFHALFQMQLLGINGAFMTGDIFNLFVFFEIMLLASYGLVLHGGGAKRTAASLHYVVINLLGSALFLVGVGVLYSILGSLNMADLAVRMSLAGEENAALLQASGLILFSVFALKAAMLPLYFWLPNTYGFTSAPVAALFAIMTKVGVYVILRVYSLIFGEHAGVAANLVEPWLLPVALITLVCGAIGVVAARDLRRAIAYMVVVSVGTLLAVIGTFTADAIASALVYLPHTTFVTAGMFLVADMIRQQRIHEATTLRPDLPVAQHRLLGLLFFAGAIAIAGLPPLSGFMAKAMMLVAVQQSSSVAYIWAIILLGGLMGLIAIGRAGSIIFWKVLPLDDGGKDAYTKKPHPDARIFSLSYAFPALALIAISPLLVMFAGPLSEFATAASQQITTPTEYIRAVLGSDVVALMKIAGGQ
ncbi:monovalent cation/H+ antiporter subunit D [Desulfurispirillum indicum]|uniref:monovalent cation/H+ antiporter subunit D n=1 Tax=Desulfurispirillum indicum TaxID=936456 RepID=UPI001CFB5E25|nr:monovalent cation/H+ antiporter subunit D [Desulfurispirillum indicum]UCZ57858.1 monovalent cation/H+ antiporter subunit D [Desulfurispirillum indicum]